MTELRAFCSQLIAFFEDLTETYPEEIEITQATQALKLLKQANPRLMHSVFMNNVTLEIAEHILAEDEEYILAKASELIRSDLKYAFWVFEKHWATMSYTNKQYVWKYIKSLVLLAKRVP